ncbi:MAG: sugar transferase [Bacteroidales bacterium]|nr:sugar transferase [Bacteroidales bacterium]
MYMKRIMDIIFSVLLIILLTPIFLIVPLIIFISMGLPLIFSQNRTGKNNRPFKIYKFRTMREKDDKYVTDEQRITWIGRLLRLFRLDELPQLFNILRGDMSFIGPRPLLPDYLPYYTEEEIRRHKVRPGLTGYSQINNLNYPKWEEQFKSDLFYVNNISFKLDHYIFKKTLLKIIKPSEMMDTGISGGRQNFDDYRRENSPKDGI